MHTKRIVLSLLTGCLILGLGSCGAKEDSSSIPTVSSQSEAMFHTLDEICDHLASLGYFDISKKSEKRADLIGAEKGYGFEVCEIYQYESDCPENLVIYGVSIPYNARNGHYGLYINNKFAGDKSAFENTFKSLNIQ